MLYKPSSEKVMSSRQSLVKTYLLISPSMRGLQCIFPTFGSSILYFRPGQQSLVQSRKMFKSHYSCHSLALSKRTQRIFGLKGRMLVWSRVNVMCQIYGWTTNTLAWRLIRWYVHDGITRRQRSPRWKCDVIPHDRDNRGDDGQPERRES